MVKNPPAMEETWVRSLGWEDLLEKGMATHRSILAWEIPWTEEPGGLQSMIVYMLECHSPKSSHPLPPSESKSPLYTSVSLSFSDIKVTGQLFLCGFVLIRNVKLRDSLDKPRCDRKLISVTKEITITKWIYGCNYYSIWYIHVKHIKSPFMTKWSPTKWIGSTVISYHDFTKGLTSCSVQFLFLSNRVNIIWTIVLKCQSSDLDWTG